MDDVMATVLAILLALVVSAIFLGCLVPKGQVERTVTTTITVTRRVPDPTRDSTGAAEPAWDCMTQGHVVTMGSAYCLECGRTIG